VPPVRISGATPPMPHILMWLTANIMISSASSDKNWLNRTVVLLLLLLLLLLSTCTYTTATSVGFINCDSLALTGCYGDTQEVFSLQEIEFKIRNKVRFIAVLFVGVMGITCNIWTVTLIVNKIITEIDDV
jgi:hypothetical protein